MRGGIVQILTDYDIFVDDGWVRRAQLL